MKSKAKYAWNKAVVIVLLCALVIATRLALIIAGFKTHGTGFLLRAFKAYLRLMELCSFGMPAAPIKDCENCAGFGRLWPNPCYAYVPT